MKFVSKFEDLINRFLVFLAELPLTLFKKYVPEAKQVKIENVIKRSKSAPKEIFLNIFNNLKNFKVLIHKITAFISHYLHVIQSAISNLNKAFTSFDAKKYANGELKQTIKGHLDTIEKKLHAFYLNAKPETILAFTICITVGILSMAHVYRTSFKIYKKEFAISTNPNEVEEIGERRPAYYKLERKSFYIANISIPFTFENNIVDKESEGVKSLIIDIEVETSNRYIRKVLMDKEHLIKDRLNRNLAPMIPTFPLGQEGKEILRQKIQLELNNLIKELGGEGEVKNVFIMHINIS